MPSPRFQHGYAHDVFLSYTHTDDQPDSGRRWVTQFMADLQARLEIVSGHSVEIWRDEEKLHASDRFNEAIAQAVRKSAVVMVVLSPSYFNSEYCRRERQEFYEHLRREDRQSIGTRIVKVAKFRVDLEKYPPDLRELLEHKFFVENPNSALCKEFHLSDDPAIRDRYHTKVDDVAQEIAGLLTGLEPTGAAPEPKSQVYLAETTSDLEPQREDLRRHLQQLGYDVQPKAELRLLPARDLRQFVAETIRKCRLAIHPVGGYYGIVPEGAEGKSVVRIQLEVARSDARNGDLSRIIWVPEGLLSHEDVQTQFLNQLRTEFAGRGFEFLERPYRAMASRVEDLLQAPPREVPSAAAAPSGVYIVCDNVDRPLAKTIRSFLFNQKLPVEWTPYALSSADLSGNADHQKLLRRNSVHLILHGETGEEWLQDRIREMDELRRSGAAAPFQCIYLANPRRDDKEDILVRDIALLEGYAPVTVADAIKPFMGQIAGEPATRAAGSSS